jgi:uncharacterized damage-inducible protein DinB
MSEDLRYPIGEFNKNFEMTLALRRELIDTIAACPAGVRNAVDGLSDEKLDTPYRPGGWTVRQTVHHIPDSHLNSYSRFKLALTEDNPTIRPYYEDRWAELADSKLPVDVSLDLLENVHKRWVVLLNSLTDEDCARKLRHPESGEWTVDLFIALYAWHGRHHTAHITGLRDRMRW